MKETLLDEMMVLIDRGRSVMEISRSLDKSDYTIRKYAKELPEEYKVKLKENGKRNQAKARRQIPPWHD